MCGCWLLVASYYVFRKGGKVVLIGLLKVNAIHSYILTMHIYNCDLHAGSITCGEPITKYCVQVHHTEDCSW